MGTIPRKAAVLTRTELYQRVWETPLARLCKEFGISDSGLARICRRHGIPLPGVGYWAKRKVGKAPRTPPLAPGDDAAIRIQPFVRSPRPEAQAPASDSEQLPDLDEDVQQLLERARRLPTVRVPASLARPHPLVAQAKAVLSRKGDVPARQRQQVLDIRVSGRCLFRPCAT